MGLCVTGILGKWDLGKWEIHKIEIMKFGEKGILI